MRPPLAFDFTTDRGWLETIGWTVIGTGATILILAIGWRKTRLTINLNNSPEEYKP